MARSRQRAALLATLAGLLGACSLLNAPEALKPVLDGMGGDEAGGRGGADPGGSSGSADRGGSSGADLGGAPGDAGSTGLGGAGEASGEAGGAGLAGAGGGPTCTDSAQDCPLFAPVCDAVERNCRGCAVNAECPGTVGQARCLVGGRCAECTNSKGCPGEAPVCGAVGMCRGCMQNDECSSGVCDVGAGTCKPTSASVYALAVTGFNTATCGDILEPCAQLTAAASKLTALRPNLVLLATPNKFNFGSAVLPSVRGLLVIGNKVVVAPYDGSFAFKVTGGSVTFDGVDLRSSRTAAQPALVCSAGTLLIKDSHFEGNSVAVSANDCDLVVGQSEFVANASPLENGYVALSAGCTDAVCAHTLAIDRSRFESNGKALYTSMNTVIQNSLFVRNGDSGSSGAYNRVLEFRGKLKLAYNTLLENYNGCSYVGLLACDSGDCEAVGNITFNNFPKPLDCPDQVFYNFTRMSYNLTETLYPGLGNLVGDPLLTNTATFDYTPRKGSRAIDNGNPLDAPKVDYTGNARPLGAAPDIGAIEAQ